MEKCFSVWGVAEITGDSQINYFAVIFTPGVYLRCNIQQWQEEKEGGYSPYSSKTSVLMLKSHRMWTDPAHCRLQCDSFGDVAALFTQPADTFCNTHRKNKTSFSSSEKNSLCLQTCAIRKSHLHPVWICWSSYMGGHCGYYWEVEALIHSAAEVDNKCVIEKGLLGVRGRATRGETLSKIETGANGSVRVSWLNHPLDRVEQIL